MNRQKYEERLNRQFSLPRGFKAYPIMSEEELALAEASRLRVKNDYAGTYWRWLRAVLKTTPLNAPLPEGAPSPGELPQLRSGRRYIESGFHIEGEAEDEE